MSAYESSIPGGSVHAGAALLAKTAYQKTLARINQQRGSTIQQAGFTSQIDPNTGMVSGLAVDPNNQYGDFQTLNRNQAQQDESSRWTAQSRGLGTGGGLAAQMRNQTRFDFGKQDAALATGLQGALSGYTDQQTQAANERDAALYQAELAAAQAAQQGNDWSPTDYSGLDFIPYGVNDPGATAAPATGVKAGAAKPAAKAPVKKPILKVATAAPKPAAKPAAKPIGSTNRSVAVPILPKKKK